MDSLVIDNALECSKKSLWCEMFYDRIYINIKGAICKKSLLTVVARHVAGGLDWHYSKGWACQHQIYDLISRLLFLHILLIFLGLYKFNSIFQNAFLTYWSFEEWTELNVFLHFTLSLLLYLYVGVWVPAGGVGHGHFGEFTWWKTCDMGSNRRGVTLCQITQSVK